MSEGSIRRSEEFLRIADQFKLGSLITESSHPVTADLSEIARSNVREGIRLLFEVDDDVLTKYTEFVASGRATVIQQRVLQSLREGGKLFFTGCGSTGRLSIQLVSIWRDFWQKQRGHATQAEDFENRAFPVMAGGDFALIKAVEGFEDFTAFGKKQIGDLGLGARDVVFAITEGGETSFVIGTAWKGVEAGAKVYFVYNNPDDVLCASVTRSREVIEEPRIEKINLTTGPMAITGSTRMQATTIQLCVLLTVMEMVVLDLVKSGQAAASVPQRFLEHLRQAHAAFKSPELLTALGSLVTLEEQIYRSGYKNNYFAGAFGIDVLTDTTERSPTYCTPPFRKFDDTTATQSWAFLFVQGHETPQAWEQVLKKKPRCVEWTEAEVKALVPGDKAERTCEIVRRISYSELMRFRIGLDGLSHRQLGEGDSAVGIVSEAEKESLLSPDGFHRKQLEAARRSGARIGVIYFGLVSSFLEIKSFLAGWAPDSVNVLVPVPHTGFLLDGVTRFAVKTVLNTLSTCTMVRLGRVMGNYMIWVVPSNLKLIDRSTRYIQKLTGLEYRQANHLLFEVIEYVEPRMKADQAYPPVVGLAVMRHRYKLDNAEAEVRLAAELGRR